MYEEGVWKYVCVNMLIVRVIYPIVFKVFYKSTVYFNLNRFLRGIP